MPSKKTDLGSHRLDGVEIFATGTHNGDVFNEADLDEFVTSFGALDFKPPLKQGHMKDIPGLPALGYMDNVRRIGKKLVADFADIPTVVMDAIRRKSYNGISIETYNDFVRAGKKYGKAIKAVALLGADIPAVAGLAPLSSLFDNDESEVTVKIYDFESEDEDNAMTKDEMDAAIAAAVTKAVQPLQAQVTAYEAKLTTAALEHETTVTGLKTALESSNQTIALLSDKDRQYTVNSKAKACVVPAFRESLTNLYSIALDVPTTKEFSVGDKKVAAVAVVDQLVADINQRAAKLFSETGKSEVERKEGDEEDDAGEEVQRRIAKYQNDNKGTDYRTALHAVLGADKALKTRYAAVQN